MSVLIYAVAQQDYRQTFDDPQVRVAEDTAARLRAGEKVTVIVPKDTVDISNSIAPWFAIYSATGTPLAASGLLGKALPQPPVTIFTDLTAQDASSTAAQTRITWQPAEGIRQAIVVVAAGDRFVVAGRNMREVEERIWHMELLVVLGWLVTLGSTLIAVWLGSRAEDFITYVRN